MHDRIQAIDSLDDPRVALYRGVSDAVLLRDHDVFVAEGRLVVRRLLTQQRFTVVSVLVTPAALDALQDVLSSVTTIYVAEQRALNAITGYNIHRGCLAIARRAPDLGTAAVPVHARRAVFLENVGNADNVGAIFRNGAAFAVDAVLLNPACCDPLYRKAVRVSMGAVLQLPFGTAADWTATASELKRRGFELVALTPQRDAMPITQYAGKERVVLMLGSEGEGLSGSAIATADVRLRVPIAAAVDSLNVATAAAIGLFQVTRGYLL